MVTQHQKISPCRFANYRGCFSLLNRGDCLKPVYQTRCHLAHVALSTSPPSLLSISHIHFKMRKLLSADQMHITTTVKGYSTQLQCENYVAWTCPHGQREPGSGITQPSIHLLAAYCNVFPIISGGRVACSRVLAASGRGGEFTQPLVPVLWGKRY